jgi:hypothetical protein
MMFGDGRGHAILARLGARKSEDPQAGSARRRVERLSGELRTSTPYFLCRSFYRLGFAWEVAQHRRRAALIGLKGADTQSAES